MCSLLSCLLYFSVFNPFSAGTVFRRQNLTSTDEHRTERIAIYNIMAADPKNRYSNESERANEDIYDFKLKLIKKPVEWSLRFITS